MTLTASTRRSGLEPTATRVTSLDEIDYVDVFDFFNVPKTVDSTPRPIAVFGNATSSVEAVGGVGQAMALTGLNSEADWLGY